MARTEGPAVMVGQLQHLLRGIAKNLLEKVYGPKGMPWGTQFADLEELAVQTGRKISLEMVQQALAQQAADESGIPSELQGCSGCGGPLQPREPEPRIVMTRTGDAEWLEIEKYCGRCRKAFFPSVQEFRD